jgi:cyclopropane fatty-acyl-phospholipid synthase-like methyltransferase
MEEKEKHWDGMYAMPLENIPWEIKEPPKELVDFLQTAEVRKRSALDVACGTGNYSFYLAQQGFAEVVGIDFSQNALDIAAKRNETLSLPVRFIHADATKLVESLGGKKFDFILDYSLLHHIAPENVAAYAKQFTSLLADDGKLLLVCYSDKDVDGTKATGKYGNDMFYRTREEIEQLYSNLTEVSYAEGRLGKRLHHIAHVFIFKK